MIVAMFVTIYNWLIFDDLLKGACGVMVIVEWNGHGDTSSNPGLDWLHFTWH